MLTEKTKVLAYILHQKRLLVFRHTQFPDAGIQVPAGTVEPGEALDVAVLREAREESGLSSLCLVAYLGNVDIDVSPWGKAQLHHRHYYHLELTHDAAQPPEKWLCYENHPSEDGPGPFEFEFFWAPYPQNVPDLSGEQGLLLPDLLSPKPINLLTRRLLMREFRREDFHELRMFHSDDQVLSYRNVHSISPDQTKEMLYRLESAARQPLHERSEVAFALVVRDTGKLVGELGFTRLTNIPGSAFIWASINSMFWGQGLLTEAARALLPFAQIKCGLCQLLARCSIENLPAQRALAKIGFKPSPPAPGTDKLEYSARLPLAENL